jgi:ABC-2 type transport system ATP-binding protein
VTRGTTDRQPQPSRPDPAASEGLVADGLVKRFGPHVVVDRVDVTLARGEVLALTGRNGTGKTTLLRMLAGLLDPDEGAITWQGRAMDDTDPWLRAQLATLLDDSGTFPDLSVGEHVELLARAFALPDPAQAATAVLEEVGIAPQRDQLPGTLSSGQRHRLGLASVLVRPATLVVLDEPEQRLDEAGRGWLAERLRGLADDGAAIVMASHDQRIVDEIADLVLELQ